MSEAASTATKSARPLRKFDPEAKADSAPKPAVNRLRQVQSKRFGPSDMHPIGQDYDILPVTAGADWTFEDVMKPEAWANVARKVARDALNTRRDKLGSIIHVHSATQAFFAELYINAVVFDNMNNPCGLKVSCIGPSIDIETGEARPIDMKTGKALKASAEADKAA